MLSIDFNALCQPLNKEYASIFGSIPCCDDYSCSQEDFLKALEKSIRTKKPIENFLKKKTIPSGPNILT